MQKLLPRHHFVEQWQNIEDDAKDLAKQLVSKEYAAPSATWKLLMSARPELILFLDITTRQSAVEQKIKAFLTKWPTYRQKMPTLKMTEMRITPDLPVYQSLLDEMFLMMLDGKLKNEAEIVKYLEPHQPPLPVAPPTPARRGRAKKKAAKVVAAPVAAAAEGAPATEQPPQAGSQPTPTKAQVKAAKKEAAAKAAAAPPPPAPVAAKAAPAKPAPAKAAPAKAAPAKAAAKKPQPKKPTKAPAKAKPAAKKPAKKSSGKKKK